MLDNQIDVSKLVDMKAIVAVAGIAIAGEALTVGFIVGIVAAINGIF